MEMMEKNNNQVRFDVGVSSDTSHVLDAINVRQKLKKNTFTTVFWKTLK